MLLMTKQLERHLEKAPLYSKDGQGLNATVEAKFFLGSYTFLCTEGSREGNDWTLYGYATFNGDEWEWGYQSFNELASVRGPFGLTMERDRFVDPGKSTVRDCLRHLGVTLED